MTDEDITATEPCISISAAIRSGVAEFVDPSSPLTVLLAHELRAAPADRGSALAGVMVYLLTDPPHPAAVMQRLYLLARALEPGLVRTLPLGAMQWLVMPSPLAHLRRVSALLAGTRATSRPAVRQDAIIEHTLAVAHQRLRAHQHFRAVSLQQLRAARKGESQEDFQARKTCEIAVLRFFFYDGPSPEQTVLRVFVMAKANYSSLIFDMTVRQLGAMFGVKGATWCERIKQKYNRFLADRGAAGVKARFQKSDTACAHYAEAQRGNQNRLGGAARCA